MTIEQIEQKIRELRELQKEAGSLIEIYAKEIREDVLWRERGAKSFQDYLKAYLGFSHAEARDLLTAIGVILTSAQLTSEDPEIQARIDLLRTWRKVKSKENGLAPFRIFSNRTLLTLALEYPQDIDALLKINGLGLKKISSFGDDLILMLKSER